MAEQRGRIQPQIHGFTGMYRQANFLNIPDNKVALALNCNNDILGALRGRSGYTAFLDSPDNAPIRNMFAWKKANGDHRLFRVSDGKIYKYSWDNGTWGAAIRSDLVDTQPIAWAVLGNLLFISDGVIVPETYDDSDFTPIADEAAPHPTVAVIWKGRLYCNDSQAKSVLFFSKSSDPTSWTNDPFDGSTGNEVSIDEDNGFDIVGLSVNADGNLIVHKENGLYLVTPDELGRPYEIIPVPTTSRATSHAAITQGEGGALYFDRRALFLSRTARPEKISRAIEDLIKGINSSNYPNICSEFFDDKFYISVGTITLENESFTNSVIVYDNDDNTFFLYTFAHFPTAWCRLVDDEGAERFFFGGYDGQVYEFGVGDDDAGVPIELRIESKPYFFNLVMADKSGLMFAAIHNPGMAAKLRYRLDLDKNTDPIEVGELAPDGITKTLFEEGAIAFNFWSFEVAAKYSGEKPTLYGVELDLAEEGVR